MAALRPQRARDRNGSSPRLTRVVPGSNVGGEESRGPAYCPARPANSAAVNRPGAVATKSFQKGVDRHADRGANRSVAMRWTPPPTLKLKELKVYGLIALAATIRLGVVGNLLAVVQGVDP